MTAEQKKYLFIAVCVLATVLAYQNYSFRAELDGLAAPAAE